MGWTPEQFWRASTWDADDAYEGYALSNGIKKPQQIPSDEARKALRARLEREKNGRP